jgi:hypothetical protein
LDGKEVGRILPGSAPFAKADEQASHQVDLKGGVSTAGEQGRHDTWKHWNTRANVENDARQGKMRSDLHLHSYREVVERSARHFDPMQ